MNDQSQETAAAELVSVPQFCCARGLTTTHAVYLSDGRLNDNPKAGQDYDTFDWDGLRQLLVNPCPPPKLDAYWAIFSTANGPDARSKEYQMENGEYWALALDMDKGHLSKEQIVHHMQTVFGHHKMFIYTTASATPDALRWRVIIQTNQGMQAAQYQWMQRAAHELLADTVVCDRRMENCSQIMFLPVAGPAYDWIETDGPPLDIYSGVVFNTARMLMLTAQSEPQSGDEKDMRGFIGWFNARYDAAQMLTACGYEQRGSNFRSPYQTSSSFATRLWSDGGWFSLSESDRMTPGLGRKVDGGLVGDSFDLFAHFYLANDRKAALKCATAMAYGWEMKDGPNFIEWANYWIKFHEYKGHEMFAGMTHVDGRILNRVTWELESLIDSIKLTGLAQEIADIVYLASDRETRAFANAAGLAAMSALASPLYSLRDKDGSQVSLHLYQLVLGPSASGKEAIRTVVRLALQAAGREAEYLDGIGSFQALQEHLARPDEEGQVPGAVTLAIDEAGIALKTINSANMGHQQQLLRGLMSLFGLGHSYLAKHKTRDRAATIPTVEHPRTTLLWTSTPEKFVDAISEKDSESGQLNRFLTTLVSEMPKLRSERGKRGLLQNDFPETIKRKCEQFRFRPKKISVSGDEASTPACRDDIIIVISEEAENAVETFRLFVEDYHIQNQPKVHRESWGRAVEYLMKVAGLLAVAENPYAPVCKVEHVSMAQRFVMATVDGISTLAERGATKNIKPDIWQVVLNYIKDHPQECDSEGWIARSAIVRGPLKNRDDRVEVVDQMISEGQLDAKTKESSGGRKPQMLRIALAD